MKDFVFITGNQLKADYLARWLDLPIEHQKVSVEELQSLDLAEVATHKARSAYKVVKRPVLVEDVALTFHALGRLPGTYVKWFLEEVGTEGLCKMLQPFDDKSATARIIYALYDGTKLFMFEGQVTGSIAGQPRSSDRATDWKSNQSWNSIFVPGDASKTYAEMTDEELKPFSHRAQAIAKLAAYLKTRLH